MVRVSGGFTDMKMLVMRFDTPKECKEMARKFLLFVVNQFDSLGYDLNEVIVWPKATALWIDREYLKNWLEFEKRGYRD
jgi:hypothetical protein